MAGKTRLHRRYFYLRKLRFSLTPVGSRVHWPSTQNLYWCSPSGRSTIATKFFWLDLRNNHVSHFSLKEGTKLLWSVLCETNYLLLSGILVAQLLKEPETKTSLATPDHLNTVGLACVWLLLSLSRSCCQARNSCISCGAWTTWYQCIVAMLIRASASAPQHNISWLSDLRGSWRSSCLVYVLVCF